MIGHGVASRSSHSEAAGRTTFAAKPWTQSRMSRWSSERSRLKGTGASGTGNSSGGDSGAVSMTMTLGRKRLPFCSPPPRPAAQSSCAGDNDSADRHRGADRHEAPEADDVAVAHADAAVRYPPRQQG